MDVPVPQFVRINLPGTDGCRLRSRARTPRADASNSGTTGDRTRPSLSFSLIAEPPVKQSRASFRWVRIHRPHCSSSPAGKQRRILPPTPSAAILISVPPASIPASHLPVILHRLLSSVSPDFLHSSGTLSITILKIYRKVHETTGRWPPWPSSGRT